MDNRELISVIVPVYKVEAYIERCVQSILQQTYPHLEIILVDDGSPDRSGEMCEELAKLDSRIVVYHKENGGLSDARNYGVQRAKGSYIGFVDSDDYIHPEMYAHLLETIHHYQVDVAECNVTRIYQNKERLHYNGEEFSQVLSMKDYIKEYLLMEKVYGSVWCKLIRADLAKKLSFAVGKYYEDIFYNYELFQAVDRVAVTSKAYYYYFIRENSITTEKYSPKQLDLIEILNKVHHYVTERYPEFEKESFNRLTYAYLSVFNHIVLEEDYDQYPEFHEVYLFLTDNRQRILRNPVANKTLKLSVVLLAMNIKLYRLLYRRYKAGMVLNQ